MVTLGILFLGLFAETRLFSDSDDGYNGVSLAPLGPFVPLGTLVPLLSPSPYNETSPQ